MEGVVLWGWQGGESGRRVGWKGAVGWEWDWRMERAADEADRPESDLHDYNDDTPSAPGASKRDGPRVATRRQASCRTIGLP